MLVLQAFGIDVFGWVDSLIVQMQKVSRAALLGAMLSQLLNLTFGGLAYVAIWRADLAAAGARNDESVSA
jgi:hypothetical protein